MSLSRGEFPLQDSRGSVYCASEPDPIGRIQYESGRLVQSNATLGHQRQLDSRSAIDGNSTEIIEVICEPQYKRESEAGELPIVACSQPPAPSLLTECQQSSGSLFSIVSAPPVPLADLENKQMDSLGVGLQPGFGLQMGGSAQNPFISTHSTVSIGDVAASAPGSATSTIPRRPASLPIETPYCPAPASRTLHASLLEHQISEIEEDDNENLLTVSSITARPLIAKSREIRSHRNGCDGGTDKRGKRGGKSKSGGGVQKAPSGISSISSARDRVSSGHPPSSRSSVSTDPPDGGYGWFIVFGAFSVQFWVAGLVKSYGVLYVEIMETFPSSTATVASWIPAILSALCLALAPVSSALCQRFSCRTVVFVGGLFCALGMTLSYFATSLVHLLFTFGILTGIGGGLSTTPGIVIVSQYFDKHRALANGICVSGTATGSFILPVLIKHLAENFGFHGTILILGFCMFDVCLSALLYRPLESMQNDEKITEEEDATKPLNDINPSNIDMLTNSTYLDTCDDGLNTKFIEHLFMEESKNRLNDYYNNRYNASEKSVPNCAQESDDEIKDIIGETTFIKPMKKVRSSGIMHSVEDLSTTSTWVYRKNSGTESNRASRRRRPNVFANDEIISKIQAHLEKPLSPPTVVTRGLSKSMEIPTPISSMSEQKSSENPQQNGSIIGINSLEEEEVDDDVPLTCYERIEIYLDISLLKDPTFILMCLSVTLMSVGCPYMLYYLPAHVISIGYNKSEAGYLVTVSAVLDLVGRLGLGWLSDLQLFDRRKIYIVCIFGAGLSVLTIPSEYTIYLVGLSAAIYGFCLGSWYVLMPVLLADIFGTDRISSSYGLVRMFQSIGAISVPPLAGFLRDLSGSYVIVFYCMGSCMVLGCLPLAVWAVLECRERKLYQANDNEDNSSVS
uniref:Major facilitator superfamily (MFS) profile domain-containing protein n=1 Tax=Musca domestica TaxID=7370 RepID=A0A1I8MLB9_MUSDO